MIITSVKAHNVLKYDELTLENLPEKGLIAVAGQNESGKSTIGETICFALFGRTFSLTQDDVHKVLRWGEDSCSVTLTFKVEDQEYSLYRYLDKNGNHSARLAVSGHEDAPLARSAKEVELAIGNILGYEFEEFVESFYLAQREITSPHPHSLAVKTMAGVAALELVSIGYEDEILQQREMLEELEAERESLVDELDELEFEEGYLVTLEDSKNQLELDLENNREAVAQMVDDTHTYLVNESKLKQAKKKRGRARFWRWISLLLAVAGGGAWALLTQQPELPQSVQLLNLLQEQVPNWQEGYVLYLGIGGAVFAVLMLLLWIRAGVHGSRVRGLQKESAALADSMASARAIEAPELEQDEEPEAHEEEQPEADVEEVDVVERVSDAEYGALLPQVQQARASGTDVSRYSEIEVAWLKARVALQEENLGVMEEEVEEELARVRQVARLQEVMESLLEKEDELRSRLDVREKALELLNGAADYFSGKFNRDIRDLMSHTLPVFTQGRYEHLQVEPDLGVRVFSSDKRDFLDLEEISSGTQRQIMLALRLALSQKLLGRAVKGRQFAFLDEPFAFFDEERTRHALEALNALSEDLSQIWIVSQTFPENSEFAAELECSGDLDLLRFA